MTDPLLGSIIADRYRIESLLGAGGMGKVYRATQLNLEREVAIKLIHAHNLTEPEIIPRFEREARVIAKLNHPNIITVHDFGNADGVLFIVMELLKGTPLSEFAKAKMPWAQTLPLVRDIARALAAAHAEGIIHRDLKPDNIMVSGEEQQRVKVLDFGIAKLQGAQNSTITQSGLIVGTPAYMAPEVVMDRGPDARADLFSLGLVWRELLTNTRIFDAPTPSAALVQVVTTPITTPSSLGVDLPAHVETTLMRLLQRDPSARYQSAADVVRALDDCIAPSNTANTSSITINDAASTTSKTLTLGSLGANSPTEMAPPTMSTMSVAVPQPSRAPVAAAVIAGAVIIAVAIIVAVRPTPTTPEIPAPPPVVVVVEPPPAPPVPAPPPIVEPPVEPPAEPPPVELPPPPVVGSVKKPVVQPKASPPAPPPPEVPTLRPLTSDDVEAAIQRNLGKAVSCRNSNITNARGGASGLLVDHCPSYQTPNGVHQLLISIAPSGDVVGVRYRDGALAQSSPLAACVLDSVKAWRFAPFAGEKPVEIGHALRFKTCIPIDGVCVFAR